MTVWMGVDLGDARVGIALSDPEESMAYPLRDITVYGDSFQALDDCIDIIEDKHVSHVVVGYPLLMSGEEGKSARKDRRWAKQLRNRLVRQGFSSVTVRLQDERLTTVTAHQQLENAGYRERSHRPMVDQQSAVIILQAALDRYSRQEGR
jgi:putative Holliday junction resolvase